MASGFRVFIVLILLCAASSLANADVCFVGDNPGLLSLVSSYDNVSMQVQDIYEFNATLKSFSGRCGWILVYVGAPSNGSSLSKATRIISSLSNYLDVVWSGYPPELTCVSSAVPGEKEVQSGVVRVAGIADAEENVSALKFYSVQKQMNVMEIGFLSHDGVNETVVYETNEKSIKYFSYDLSETPGIVKAVALNYRGVPIWTFTPSNISYGSNEGGGLLDKFSMADYLLMASLLAIGFLMSYIARLRRIAREKSGDK
ncbi:MAG: hypothetical protein NTU61_01815 [Candidatus Altiarchaeota archaeon]|nr:hypothetical protein [Candidatus Altiarchaeota archaeon]